VKVPDSLNTFVNKVKKACNEKVRQKVEDDIKNLHRAIEKGKKFNADKIVDIRIPRQALFLIKGPEMPKFRVSCGPDTPELIPKV
jgi:hypothetical protein